MYQTRQRRLINHLQTEQNMDVALITSPTNIYYYTGFLANPHERFFALAIDTKKDKTMLFLPSLDEQAAKEKAEVTELIPIDDHENAFDKFRDSLGKVDSFAFEKSHVTVMQYEQIAAYFNNTSFTNIEPFILSERLTKSTKEIDHVKKAIQITEEGLAHTIPKIALGLTELQIKAELEYQLTVLGSNGLAFDTLVLSGGKSALPHGTAGERPIQNGDFLLFDFGVNVNGYCSDLTRTFIIGEGTEKQSDIYNTVLAANEKAISQVKVGDELLNIDRAARDFITSKGYGNYFTHRIGHGLGLEVHEKPSIHNENKELIQPGMLFTIEPGIYVPKIGGVRIEDNIYITEDGGVEVLSSYPKKLTYIPI